MALTEVMRQMVQEKAHRKPDAVRFWSFASLFVALAVICASLAAPAAKAEPSTRPSSAIRAQFLPVPISGVILADESGSETAASIRAERDAATALVDSDPSSASRFMIAGFGSQDRPGQEAVTPYCDFITTSSPTARDSLAACADRIRARTESQGWNTDHAQALEFAIQHLRERPGLKVIFLMTDGNLDVHDSPIYGRLPSQRTPEAWRIIDQQILPLARAAGIQIWPLGFGPEASYAGLERFASGGGVADARCASSAASRPSAIVVSDFLSLIYRLVSAQTVARCGSVGAPTGGSLGSEASITFHVGIPPIASYGSLTVVTGNPLVRTAFIAPNGVEVPRDGLIDGQMLHQAGAGTDIQTLRIVNPMPGMWTVKLSAPHHLVTQTKAVAFASWEGVLSASLFVSPVEAIPGRPVNIELHVLSRNGVVVGSALSHLTPRAVISGTFGSIGVPLRVAGDAFRGTAALPQGTSRDVLVSAEVSGAGIAGYRASETLFTQSYDFLSGEFAISVPSRVYPGGSLHGELTTINQGAPTRGFIRVEDSSPGALVTLAAGPVAIPSGTSAAPLTLRISPRTRLGPAFVSVVLERASGQAISSSPVDLWLVPRPSWWEQARPWAIPIGIVLAMLAVSAAARARFVAARCARAADTQGLTATLLVDGIPAGPPLSSDGGEVFSLAVTNDSMQQLLHADVAGDSGIPIAVRRTDHSASIVAGDEAPRQCRFGEPIAVGPGLALQIDSLNSEAALEHDDAATGETPAASNTDDSVPLTGHWR
jgi:hypothetical protein